MRKKQHFSQSLFCGELWTVRRLALAHTVTEICTTSFVNFAHPLYAKIHTFSTCTCAKETTFFTISWWTLNCPSFSSSSYGYRDMHHFICQFCHTDLYAEGAKIHKFHVCERNNKFAGGHFVFIKSWWKYTLKPQKCRIVFKQTGRGENSLVFCILQYGQIFTFCTSYDVWC